jgi:hypothetical protein
MQSSCGHGLFFTMLLISESFILLSTKMNGVEMYQKVQRNYLKLYIKRKSRWHVAVQRKTMKREERCGGKVET